MSEYQYYEFLAVDRPLTEREMRELRAVSSRAVITATRFTNHYEWGNFKGDPRAWMERYFDAFLHFANWGTRELMLRLPRRVLDPATARRYCRGGGRPRRGSRASTSSSSSCRRTRAATGSRRTRTAACPRLSRCVPRS